MKLIKGGIKRGDEREREGERGNGEDAVFKKESNKWKRASRLGSLPPLLPECSVSPGGRDAYVNRLSTPPVLLAPVLYAPVMIHAIFT